MSQVVFTCGFHLSLTCGFKKATTNTFAVFASPLLVSHSTQGWEDVEMMMNHYHNHSHCLSHIIKNVSQLLLLLLPSVSPVWP